MKEWKKVLLLTVVGLIYRSALFVIFRHHLFPGGDQIQIILLARKFASGDFYGVLDTYWTPFYPVLLGIFSFFSDSLIVPSVIVSIIAGSLAIPLTYLFIRQSYGKRIALIGGLIAVFYPHLINSVFDIGSENIYFLLVIGALYLGWKSLEENSAKLYFITGVMIGLAYLTRPEAFGYIAFFVLLALLKDLWKGAKFSLSSLRLVATFLIGVAIFAIPYLAYLRNTLGFWTISGKIIVNFADGSFNSDVAAGVALTPTQPSALDFVQTVILNLFHIHNETFAFLIPVLLVILVALGLFGNNWAGQRFRRESFLILFCLVTILGYASSVVQTRYFYILLPIFFGWIAIGIVRINDWFRTSTGESLPARLSFFHDSRILAATTLSLIFLYVFPINFFFRSNASLWKSNPYEERAAGEWINLNSDPGDLVFSATRPAPFYAKRRHLEPKSIKPDEIYLAVNSEGAKYVVLSERALKRNPYLEGFEKKFQNDSSFELVFKENKKKGYGIVIFKRK